MLNFGKTDIISKSAEVFLSLGFSLVQINGKTAYELGGSYFKFSLVKSLNSYVIESADSLSDAKKNLYEDSDLIPADTDEDNILTRLRELLTMYYADTIINKIKQMLISKGFVEKVVTNAFRSETNYVLGDLYCIPQYVKSLGFLIEYAHSHTEAKNHGHEDGDSFPLNIGEDEILNGIEKEIDENILYHGSR